MNTSPAPLKHEIEFRVRYAECDAQGVAHHSVYAVWLEMARVELLRVRGVDYGDVEKAGLFFVVARLNLRFRKPAMFDDLLQLHIEAKPTSGIKLEHTYRLMRGPTLLAEAETTLVCVDRSGRPTRISPQMLEGSAPPSG